MGHLTVKDEEIPSSSYFQSFSVLMLTVTSVPKLTGSVYGEGYTADPERFTHAAALL